MLFVQSEFFIFFAVVFIFLLAVRHHRSQKIFLLASSWFFYAWWDYRFLSLILISTVVDYLAGQGMKRTDNRGSRKALLMGSLVANLGILGFFKYCNFFIESFAAFVKPLGFHPGTLSIILPIGISFYTFQTLSYTIDVYRRKIPTCDDPFDFALYVAFFPQLMAGPIVRASDFLPQLSTPRTLSWDRTFQGGRQIITGLFKKVLIADYLAVFIDGSFTNAGMLDTATTWLAAVCFAIQIYCDFSGYTDMAIGIARMMGYDFKQNFRYPYIAISPTDFWRRWHISLSTWLKDYLYIPLGGNRKGIRRTYINLMITMLLGGLWHGATWTFVVWGAFHGIALVLHKWMAPALNLFTGPSLLTRRIQRLTGWAVTMLIVLVGWILFRAETISDAMLMLRAMFTLSPGMAWYPSFALFALFFIICTHLPHAIGQGQWTQFPRGRWYTPFALFIILWCVIVLHPTGSTPFIYFQF
ncbi:MAG: MBOAT family protein [Deltaproteobacteria bacterium]|nr:MBOAT family protein [Deltaproteobacteria bacterium]